MNSKQSNLSAFVSFKDDYDQVIYTKEFPLSTTIAEIIGLNSPENKSLWIDFKFDAINLFERIELFRYDETEKIRFTYDFNVNALFPKPNTNENWKVIAEQMEYEILKKEKQINEIFKIEPFVANWGGPAPETKTVIEEVNYYIDNKTAWIYVQKLYDSIQTLELMNLKKVSKNAINMSFIIQEIIKNINE